MTKVFDINPDGVVEREATAQEITARKEALDAYNARIAKEESDAVARQAVLDRLGLTEKEAQLIIGGSN